MESRYLASFAGLTMAQKTSLAKGKLQTVKDLLLKKPADVAKECRLNPKEVEFVIDLVCKELYQPPSPLKDISHIGEEKFTTGEPSMDEVLGGGFRTGMIWEVAGQNNVGKTQLALQLSLMVQLPARLGGLNGATRYITTREGLHTERMKQMIANHPLLSSQLCSLNDVRTLHAFNYGAFARAISEIIPQHVEAQADSPNSRPVKLIIVDVFSDLFDPHKHPDYEGREGTAKRARELRQASLVLHTLANKHKLAVILFSSTRPTRPRADGDDRNPGELRYSDQERWFARAHSIRGEDANEAILGHVWPNQLNARVMMSRTIRTRTRAEITQMLDEPNDDGRGAKRRRLDSGQATPASQPAEDEAIAFRRFSVIFSSVAPPASCDYVVLDRGVVAFTPPEEPPSTLVWATPTPPPPSDTPATSAPGGNWQVSTPPNSSTSGRGRNAAMTPKSGQSLSYVPAPTSPQATPPDPTNEPPSTDRSATEDAEDAMLWELTQEQGALFDQLPDEEAAAEGPPLMEEEQDGQSSDGELWRNFDQDF